MQAAFGALSEADQVPIGEGFVLLVKRVQKGEFDAASAQAKLTKEQPSALVDAMCLITSQNGLTNVLDVAEEDGEAVAALYDQYVAEEQAADDGSAAELTAELDRALIASSPSVPSPFGGVAAAKVWRCWFQSRVKRSSTLEDI